MHTSMYDKKFARSVSTMSDFWIPVLKENVDGCQEDPDNNKQNGEHRL